MNRLSWLPLVGLLGACGPASVSGVVDGQGVGGARDALYDTLELDFGPLGELNVMLVIVTDIPQACDVYEEFFETVEPNCESRCDDYMGIARDYLGSKEYWSLTISAVSNGSFENTYDYEDDQLDDEEFALGFARYDAEPLYDADACEDACQDGDLLVPDEETGNGGDLEITAYESGDYVKGRFDVDMGGDERLRGSFTAAHCDMVDWIPWL